MQKQQIIKLGLGGGCHWCTEAVFSSLNGVKNVQQGWLSSTAPNDQLSEGVLLEFDSEVIRLKDIVDIHLESHSSKANHSMRDKYRSAIYVQNKHDETDVLQQLALLKAENEQPNVTQVLPLNEFKCQSNEKYVDYFYQQPDKPFCKTHIMPKLKRLLVKHSDHFKKDSLSVINEH